MQLLPAALFSLNRTGQHYDIIELVESFQEKTKKACLECLNSLKKQSLDAILIQLKTLQNLCRILNLCRIFHQKGFGIISQKAFDHVFMES